MPSILTAVVLILIVLFGVLRGWSAYSGAPVHLDRESARPLLWMSYSAQTTPYPIIESVERISPNAAERMAGVFHAIKRRIAPAVVESDAVLFLFMCGALLAVPAYLLARTAGVSRVWALFGAGMTAASPVVLRPELDTGRFAEEVPAALAAAMALWLWITAERSESGRWSGLCAALSGAMLGVVCGIDHARIYAGMMGITGFGLHYENLKRGAEAEARSGRLWFWASAGFAGAIPFSGASFADLATPSLAPWYAGLTFAAALHFDRRFRKKPLPETVRFAWLFFIFAGWVVALMGLAVAWKSRDWAVFRQLALRPLYLPIFKTDRTSLWSLDQFPHVVRLRDLIGPQGLAWSLWLTVLFWTSARPGPAATSEDGQRQSRVLIDRWGWGVTALTLMTTGLYRGGVVVWVSVVCASVMDARWKSARPPARWTSILVLAAATAAVYSAAQAPFDQTGGYAKRHDKSAEVQMFFKRTALRLPGDAVIWSDWRDGYWLQHLMGRPAQLVDRREDPDMRERIKMEKGLLNSKKFAAWIAHLRSVGVTHVVLNDEALDPGTRSRVKNGASGYYQAPEIVRLLDREKDLVPMARSGFYRVYELKRKG